MLPAALILPLIKAFASVVRIWNPVTAHHYLPAVYIPGDVNGTIRLNLPVNVEVAIEGDTPPRLDRAYHIQRPLKRDGILAPDGVRFSNRLILHRDKTAATWVERHERE